VACLATLVLATSEITLAGNINGMIRDMLGLKITFDNQTILLLSAFAGIGIVIVEYALTLVSAKKASQI